MKIFEVQRITYDKENQIIIAILISFYIFLTLFVIFCNPISCNPKSLLIIVFYRCKIIREILNITKISFLESLETLSSLINVQKTYFSLSGATWRFQLKIDTSKGISKVLIFQYIAHIFPHNIILSFKAIRYMSIFAQFNTHYFWYYGSITLYII